MKEINPLSISSFYTETFFNEIKLGTATSFAYKYKDKKFLITNYHVAFGLNPENNILLNNKGAIPNKIIINYYTKDFILMYYTILFGDQQNPFKFIKIYSTIVDIAVFQLDDKFNGVCINEIENLFNFPKFETDIILHITEQLYVLGYPRSINIYNTPIWKRSSIASEPELDPNEIPYFYIDTTTREGMSGAPVIFYTENGNYKRSNGCQVLAGGNAYNLAGIYSGRDHNDESHIAQLGKVWKKELIEKIIEEKFINI